MNKLFSEEALTMLGLTTARIAVWVVCSFIVWLLAKRLVDRMEKKILAKAQVEGEPPTESARRIDTLGRLLQQGIFLLLIGVVTLGVLREIGIEIGPILASAGVVGLAVGFGAQNLVRDIISGFFLLLENQVRVGDVATVNGTGGLVEELNFRTIVLRDLSGVVHVFPNGSITTLSNQTRGWSGYVMEIGVAYKENIDHVIAVMKNVSADMKKDHSWGRFMLEVIEVFGVDSFADSAVVIKARLKTRPLKQWDIGREYLKRLKVAFDSEKIEFPFPQRTLTIGAGMGPLLEKIFLSKQEKPVQSA